MVDFDEVLQKCVSVDDYEKLIEPSRIHVLNDKPLNDDGLYVLYWCQGAPRAEWNQANDHALSLVVCFGALIGYPLASERHAYFMLEGLQEFKQVLAYDRGIRLFVGKNTPDKVAIQLAKYAVEVVVDMNYLRVQRQWYEMVATDIPCTLTQIETNVVVPVELTYDAEQADVYAFRQQLLKDADDLLRRNPSNNKVTPEHCSLDLPLPFDAEADELDMYELDRAVDALPLDRSVKRVYDYTGGYFSAAATLKQFVVDRLPLFADSTSRDNPGRDVTSRLSAYLNWGHISPIEVVLSVKKSEASEKAKNAYLDRILVLREKAVNSAWFNQQYDTLLGGGLPDWALTTIERHASDRRPYVYSLKQLEAADTEDPLWNAAQLEMVHSGKMHSMVRVYWGKKVMEWTPDMETAFNYLVYLNDKFEMDGRDPVSYYGIAGCFGKGAEPKESEEAIFGRIGNLERHVLRAKFGKLLDDYVVGCYVLACRLPPVLC